MDNKVGKESINISDALKNLRDMTSQRNVITYTEQDIVNAYVIFKDIACDYMITHKLNGEIKAPEQACLVLFNAIEQVYGIDMFDVIAKSDGQ
jgi:hypothetical protein